MSYISVVEYNGDIHSWERNSNGELLYDKTPVEDYLYLFMVDNTGTPTHTSIYGDPLKKVYFDSKKDLKTFAESRSEVVFESDVQPVYRFLLDNHIDSDANAPYNAAFFDIEVDFNLEDGLGYPTIRNPFGEINSISIFDDKDKCYIMMIPQEMRDKVKLSDEELPVEILWTRNERDMLECFADYLDHVDIFSAWNGSAFDVNYIIARAELHFGSKKASRMFCREGIPARKKEFVNEYGEDTWEWVLIGRNHLDMMQLFKKFHPGEKKSFKLDVICEEFLGKGKVEFEDNLGSLYRENPQKFYEYSLHDSRLLKMLDDKEKIINLAMMMVRDMCSLPSDINGSIRMIEMGLIKYARKKGNIVVPDKVVHDKDEQYAGAVVYDSIPGRHEWVFSADLVSLYPKCMILLGISPETLIYQCDGGYEDYISVIERDDSDGKIVLDGINGMARITMLPSEVDDMVRREGYTISANGTLFNGKMGFMAEWLSENFALRTEYKRKMKEHYKAGNMDESERYDLYQQSTKIGKLNAVYGAAGNQHFRFYDVRIAQSVTLTAQIISKAQATFANEAIDIMKEV